MKFQPQSMTLFLYCSPIPFTFLWQTDIVWCNNAGALNHKMKAFLILKIYPVEISQPNQTTHTRAEVAPVCSFNPKFSSGDHRGITTFIRTRLENQQDFAYEYINIWHINKKDGWPAVVVVHYEWFFTDNWCMISTKHHKMIWFPNNFKMKKNKKHLKFQLNGSLTVSQ